MFLFTLERKERVSQHTMGNTHRKKCCGVGCHKPTTQTVWSIPHCVPTYSLVIPSQSSLYSAKRKKQKSKSSGKEYVY